MGLCLLGGCLHAFEGVRLPYAVSKVAIVFILSRISFPLVVFKQRLAIPRVVFKPREISCISIRSLKTTSLATQLYVESVKLIAH